MSATRQHVSTQPHLTAPPDATRPNGVPRCARRRSLAFLAKKSWHTTNLKNVEQVWLAEQQKEEEERKLETWKKEREEERQIAELKELQHELSKTYAAAQPRSPPGWRAAC